MNGAGGRQDRRACEKEDGARGELYFRFLMQQVGSGIGDVLNSTGRKVATGMILAQVNGCGRLQAVQVTASNRYAWLCEDMAGAIMLAGLLNDRQDK